MRFFAMLTIFPLAAFGRALSVSALPPPVFADTEASACHPLNQSGAGEMDAGTDPLKYQKRETAKSGELMTVKMRYKQPGGDKSILIEKAHTAAEMTRKEPSADFRFASAVAEFALLLENSKHKGDASFAKLIERARTANDWSDQLQRQGRAGCDAELEARGARSAG